MMAWNRIKLGWRRKVRPQSGNAAVLSKSSQEAALIDRTKTTSLEHPRNDPSISNAAAEQTKDTTELSLWDEAYNSLRARKQALLEKYEELLSRELPPEQDDQSAEASNEAHTEGRQARQERLKLIIKNGLQRMDEGKTNYVIFGHEFVPRDQVAAVGKSVQSLKGLVDEAVKASPEASLAWAGVCCILPILTNPAAAEEANRDGFVYVTSRMRFYVELERLVWSLGDFNLREEANQRLVELYENILEFQIKTVLRFYNTRLRRLGGDVFQSGTWNDMISKIKDLEKAFDADLQKISGLSSRWELEKIRTALDDFAAKLTSLLDVLVKSCESPAGTVFRQDGSGQQVNYAGDVHNRSTGSGSQFPGAIFSAPVYLSKQ